MGAIKHPPELLLCDQWPMVEQTLMKEEELRRFNACKAAMEAVCHGEKPSHVARRFGISRSGLSYLLDRCVVRHPDGRLWGFRALIRGSRQVPYKRTKDAKVAPDSDGYGLSGAFRQLLAHHPRVVTLIRSKIDGVGVKNLREGGLNLAAMHAEILELLRKAGVGNSEYPFNTKSAGYFSLVNYINQLMTQGDNGIARNRLGQPSLDGLQAGTGKVGILHALHPLDIACYDEQKLPFIGTLVIEINGEEIDVPLSRGHLCILVDTETIATLGYAVTVADRFRSLQLLATYEQFFTPWKPKVLTVTKMKYREGAGLPSGIVPECRGRLVNVISVDNHLTHLAESVVGHLRKRTGAIVRYGRVRQWISRQVVEGVFAELQKHSFTRIPSTTGSGPGDPAVSKPVKKAVDFRIRMETLLELIDVILANHNAEPKRMLMSKTPLQALASGLGERSRLSIIPSVPNTFLADPQIAVEIIASTVRGSREKGRRPYIEIDGGKYTNDILCQSWNLIGKKFTVHIRGDFRKVRVFRDDGSEFGVLMVIGHWARSFHTRETRKEINKMHREKLIDMWADDPVHAYMEHLAHLSLKKAAKNPYKISKESGKLATVLHEQDSQNLRHNLKLPDDTGEPARRPLKSRGRRKFFGDSGGAS